MGLTVAALVVAFFALQTSVIGEEIIRTVRYVPVPSNLPSTKYGVLHSFKDNSIPKNVTLNETRLNSSNNTRNVSQYEQKKYGSTGVYSPQMYASNTQYQPNAYSSNLQKYLEGQTHNTIGENYESPNNEINVLRIENSGVVEKGNQNLNNYEVKQMSQVNNKNHVSDIEILESQNYHENQEINLNSDGRKNYVEINASERQLKENKNKLQLSESLGREHGSDLLYEKITHFPKIHKTIHHNHGAIHNVPLGHKLAPKIRAPVPVSKTATYSINYLYPMDGYNVKNVGSNLFLYKTNNNEHHLHHQPPEDEEIGESDLDHLPDHSYGSATDWEKKLMNNKFKYNAPNEKEINVNTDASLEVVSIEGGDEEIKLIKTGEDFYTKALHVKEKDNANAEKSFASQITFKEDEKFDLSQLKKGSSSFKIKEVNGRKDSAVNIESMVDSYDRELNKNEKFSGSSVMGQDILITNGVSSVAKEFGIQRPKINVYEDNSDYSSTDNLEALEYRQNYKYVDTQFIPKDYTQTTSCGNCNHNDETENIENSDKEYISNIGTKIKLSNENYIISNVDTDSEDMKYEYNPKHIAGIKSYEYEDDEDNQNQKYEYNIGKYDSIYSGTDNNEIISQYYAKILEHGRHHSLTNDASGYNHNDCIKQNGEHYRNDYINGRPAPSDNEVYKHYKQNEYFTKDDSESPQYYNNAEITEHRKHLEEAIIEDDLENISKLTENNLYSSNYNSESSKHDHTHLDNYEFSPKMYAHIAKPESGFDAHHQYDYISESGSVYDGYEKNGFVSKPDSKLTESDENYYISKYDKDTEYHAYENIPEIKGINDISKDYETHKYFGKNGKGYEQHEYIVRDGSEYGVTADNEYILNNDEDIGEYGKIYISDDAEFRKYNSIPEHYAHFETSDSNDYILNDNADVTQYEPNTYITAGELKYGYDEQYKNTLNTNQETEYKKYINSVGIKEYENILEDSIDGITHYSGDMAEYEQNQLKNNDKVLLKNVYDRSYINDMKTNVDVAKEENRKYFSTDVILENDWTKVDESLKDDKLIYHNPSITAGSEMRLPIESTKHYLFNEAIYSENESKHDSQNYMNHEVEKDIPYGYYVDTHDQYVHLKDWPVSSFAKNEEQIIISENENNANKYLLSKIDDNEHEYDSIYANDNKLVYSDDSEALNDDELLVEGKEKLNTGIIEDINHSGEQEDIKYYIAEKNNYFPRNEKFDIHFDNDEIINKNDKTESVLYLKPSNTESDGYIRDSFTYGTINSEEYNNYPSELEEHKLDSLKNGLTYGTESYLPPIYESHKIGYQSYDSDYYSEFEEQDLLYSQKQYLPTKEIPYETIVDSQDVKDVDLHLTNWPVSIYKFDPEYFHSLKEGDLNKVGDGEVFVETNINEPYKNSIVPYFDTNLKEELEVQRYDEKSVMLENSDEESQNYDEIFEFTDVVSVNNNNKKSLQNSYLSDLKGSFEPLGLVTSEKVYEYSHNPKDIQYDVTEEDNYTPRYENLDIYHSNPSKLIINDIKYNYPKSLPYHTNTNYDFKENYDDDDQMPSIISETPLLLDVNKEDHKNGEYFAPETKCSHLHGHNVNGHLKFSLQHNSDKKSSFNYLQTELKYNPLGLDNLNGKFNYDDFKKPPVISVGAHLSQNGLDSFKIKHPTIHLDSDPVPETKVNEYYSAEDLDEINSVEVTKCKQCYNRKSVFPKNNRVKQFSPIPTFPIKNHYEMCLKPKKQNKLKSSPHATFPFIPNCRFIRSPEIVFDCPDCSSSQSTVS